MKYILLFSFLYWSEAAHAQPDTVHRAASLRYTHPSVLQKIFIGGNYRKTWSQPVTLKIFHLQTAHGGFTIGKLGGGLQTASLRMTDKSGEEWALRTVDKTVDKAMKAEGIKSSFIRTITQDMISAAHPYGTLVVPPMAHALGILSTEPEVFFVPDDAAFGEYRVLFANTVCLLEKRQPTFHRGDKVKDTKDLYKDLEKHSGKHRPDKQMLLQARLLDMLIGDWDRHGNQWKWDYHQIPGAESVSICPIPRDHDQALFNSNGLLIKLVRPFTLQHIIGFKKRSTRLKKLNKKEWYFDHSLLQGLSEKEWQDGIASFQKNLTDEVLQEAAKRLPAQVYARQGEWLFHRLQSRRNSMMKGAMEYCRFLQTERAARAVDPREKKMARMQG